MNQRAQAADTMDSPISKKRPIRLLKKAMLFRILQEEPWLTVDQLCQRAASAGLNLTRISAYRALKTYKESKSLEETEVRCLRLVSSILQNTESGIHLSVRAISSVLEADGIHLHKSSIYRVLERLNAAGLILIIKHGRQKLYEWKRHESPHGHLSCIKCGQTLEFDLASLTEPAKQACKKAGFEYSHFEFLLRSFCPECRAAPEPPEFQAD